MFRETRLRSWRDNSAPAAMLISCIVLAAAIVSEPSAAHGVSGVQPSPDSEQGFLPLIDRSLESWERVQLPRNAASIRDRSLLMTGAPGWLRTRKPFSDFVLRFESRFKDPSATFSILLRAVDATRHSPVPANGYAVRIEAGGPQGPPRATVVAFSQQGDHDGARNPRRLHWPFRQQLYGRNSGICASGAPHRSRRDLRVS